LPDYTIEKLIRGRTHTEITEITEFTEVHGEVFYGEYLKND